MNSTSYKINDTINNPKTGTPIFGIFPHITHQRSTFSEGPIYLRYGRHTGPHRGFGLVHIFEEHKREIERQTSIQLFSIQDAIEVIPMYINSILVKDAAIHSEFDLRMRCTIVKTKNGLVLLEPFKDGEDNTYYSIVTAYKGQAKGPRIGAL